jgi:fucose 4-O-acetylase-like acetyltransferase
LIKKFSFAIDSCKKEVIYLEKEVFLSFFSRLAKSRLFAVVIVFQQTTEFFYEDKNAVKMSRINRWFLLFCVIFLCVNDGFTGKYILCSY